MALGAGAAPRTPRPLPPGFGASGSRRSVPGLRSRARASSPRLPAPLRPGAPNSPPPPLLLRQRPRLRAAGPALVPVLAPAPRRRGPGAGQDTEVGGRARCGGGMGWALLGAGLLLALYTLLRHGLRRAPPPLAPPALGGRTAIVTGERRAGPRAGLRAGPRAPRSPLCAPLRSAGGSGGIGAATALELARGGARVILASRSAPRGEAAARRIRTVSAAAPAAPGTPPRDGPGHPRGTPRAPHGAPLGDPRGTHTHTPPGTLGSP